MDAFKTSCEGLRDSDSVDGHTHGDASRRVAAATAKHNATNQWKRTNANATTYTVSDAL